MRKAAGKSNLLTMARAPQDRGFEFKVGAFVLLGLAMLAALVVQFGRVGEGFKTYYDADRSLR